MFAQGSLLAQMDLGDTDITVLFTATMRTEVTRIQVVNTTSNDSSFRLYHRVEDGDVDSSNALMYNQDVDGHSHYMHASPGAGSGIMMSPGDRLAVKAADADRLMINIYGITVDRTGQSNG